jgi:hypothetical protein
MNKVNKVDALIFIDANQYIELYGLRDRKVVLEFLGGQQDYIFLTSQVVDEVHRNKVKAAIGYIKDSLERLQSLSGMPQHLLCLSKEELSELNKKASDVKSAVMKAVAQTLERISKSEDELSIALNELFSKAHPHSAEEIHRARERKERGNPPGKGRALGDELTWEQLLSHYSGESNLWIITKDADYCTKTDSGLFLNAFLYKELLQLNPQIKVFCFDTWAKGIEHFSKTLGVDLQKRILPAQVEQIKKEQESLPPWGWQTEPQYPLYYLRSWHPAYYTSVSGMSPVLYSGVPPVLLSPSPASEPQEEKKEKK